MSNPLAKKRTFKNCQRCSKEFHAKSSTAKYCMDCRVDVMDERGKAASRRRSPNFCDSCLAHLIKQEKIECENNEGKTEHYCKPCYRKLVFD